MRESNTRLDKLQKMDRKKFLRMLDDECGFVFSYPESNATVVMVREFPGSRMMRVAVSCASPDEKKFRRKVGEYHALNRLYWLGEFIRVPVPQDCDFDEWAYCFATGFLHST